MPVEPALWNNAFTLNQAAGGGGTFSSAAVLANGNTIAIWNDGSDIKTRQFDPFGAPLGNESVIVANGTNGFITALAGGGYALTYTTSVFGTADTFASIYNAAGTLTANYAVSGSTTNFEYARSITGLANGNFVVGIDNLATDLGRTLSYEILYNTAGTVLSVNNAFPGAVNGSDTAVKGLVGGNYVVAASFDNGNVSGQNVFYTVYNSSGGTVLGPTIANVTGGGFVGDPNIAALSNGFFAMTWLNEATLHAASAVVYMRVFDANGNSQTAFDIPVGSAITPGHGGHKPVITGLPDGTFAVTWTGVNASTSAAEIDTQLFTASGQAVGDIVTVNIGGAGIGAVIDSVVASPDGRLLVTWTNFDNGSADVVAQYIDPRITFTFDGTAGNDFIAATPATNAINASAGNDKINGAAGFDTVDYGGFLTPITAVIAGGNGVVSKSNGIDTLTSIERIVGGGGNDVFYLDSAEKVDGGGGFNILIELSTSVSFNVGDSNHLGIDEVVANAGTNTIGVELGEPTLVYLYGGGGTNTLTTGSGGGYEFSTGGVNHMFGGGNTNVFVGGIGSSDMHGGSGANVYYVGASDTVSGAGTYNTEILLATGVTLNLGASSIQLLILNGGTNTVSFAGASGFTYVYGGAGTNTMTIGSGGGYELSTGGVNHMFGGTAGTDVFIGGIGTSDMHGGGGVNYYYVGANDTVAGAGTFNVLVELNAGVSTTIGTAGHTNIQQVIAAGGNNTIDASAVASTIYLYGNSGSDHLVGGSGNDFLYGGGGGNTFQFNGSWGKDTITDWTAGAGNVIDFHSTGLTSFGQITQQIVNGNDVITSGITGSNQIVLNGVVAPLAAGSFIFA